MNNAVHNIVLLSPPVSLEDVYGKLAKVGSISPPLTLLLLAAIAKKHGFVPHIIDCPAINANYAEIAEIVNKLRPIFIGITAMTPHIMQAAKLGTHLKKILPNIPLALGGVHVTSLPEETMRRFSCFDIGFIGEADNSFPEVLEALKQGTDLALIPGLILRKTNQIQFTASREERIELDTLPIFAWDVLPGFPDRYKTPYFSHHRQPATPILTSRGCPGKCIFCFSGAHKTISSYSAEYIINMLQYLKNTFGIKEFMVYDDNFLSFKKNFKHFLKLLHERRVNMAWSCNSRVDMIDMTVLQQMKDAGCWQISFGIETGNVDIMKTINKGITKEKIIYALSSAKKVGLCTVGYFMIGHFGETKETILDTEKFMLECGVDEIRMSFFTPMPGTSSYGIAEQYGTFENDWEKMTVFSPVFVPYGLTKEFLISEQRRIIKSFFLRPRPIWQYLKRIRNPIILLKSAAAFLRYVYS